MKITCGEEAGSTYQRLVQTLIGYIVRITPEGNSAETSQPFDAKLLGLGAGEMRNSLAVVRTDDEGEVMGQPEDVDADEVYVY